jgi:general secretion pathway protein L
MIALGQIVSSARETAMLLRRFAEWWIGELTASIPGALRRRFEAGGARLVIVIDGSRARLLLENGKPPEPLASIDLTPGHDSGADVHDVLRQRRLVARMAAGRIETCVRIPDVHALRTTIDLPVAAEGNLDEVVSFELDRHTPFKAEQVYCAAQPIGRDPVAKRLRVRVTLVPRAVADEALAIAAERLRLPADRLDIGTGDQRSALTGNLLPPLSAARRRSSTIVAALAVAAACLAIIAIYLPIARVQREAETTASEFAAVRTAVALNRQIEELKKEQRFLVDRKAEAPMVSTLLLETTHLLPDDTSLSTWQLAGSEVQFGGTTHSAAALIPLLERSPVFHNTGFRTPVTQDPVSGRESFYIAAQAAAGAP